MPYRWVGTLKSLVWWPRADSRSPWSTLACLRCSAGGPAKRGSDVPKAQISRIPGRSRTPLSRRWWAGRRPHTRIDTSAHTHRQLHTQHAKVTPYMLRPPTICTTIPPIRHQKAPQARIPGHAQAGPPERRSWPAPTPIAALPFRGRTAMRIPARWGGLARLFCTKACLHGERVFDESFRSSYVIPSCHFAFHPALWTHLRDRGRTIQQERITRPSLHPRPPLTLPPWPPKTPT